MASPLDARDFDTSDLQTVSSLLKIYFNDPKFFRMLLSKMKLWEDHQQMKLKDFLETPAMRAWYQRRKKMKRPALFELDEPFKSSKKTALANIVLARKLMREHPLLRYQDLKTLGIKNAQSIYENFKPFLLKHREAFYEKLRQKVDL